MAFSEPTTFEDLNSGSKSKEYIKQIIYFKNKYKTKGKIKNKNRYKYRPSNLLNDDNAVSNVVTSIMMLGIFLSILAMIFTVYIPIWAKTGEAKHMESVESSFLDLKSTIDSQIADDQGIDSTRNTPIKLGAEGGAVMGIGRTTGSLDFRIRGFDFIITNTNDSQNLYGKSFGKMFFKSKNIYYTDQYFTYENGAVIVEQEGKAVMRAKPDFNIVYDELNNKTTLVTTQIQLSGDSSDIDGSGYHSIETTLIENIGQSHQFVWTAAKGFPFGQNLTINITTEFGTLWEELIQTELEEFPASVRVNMTNLTMTQFNDPITKKDMYTIILTIQEVNILDCKKGIIEININ